MGDRLGAAPRPFYLCGLFGVVSVLHPFRGPCLRHGTYASMWHGCGRQGCFYYVHSCFLERSTVPRLVHHCHRVPLVCFSSPHLAVTTPRRARNIAASWPREPAFRASAQSLPPFQVTHRHFCCYNECGVCRSVGQTSSTRLRRDPGAGFKVQSKRGDHDCPCTTFGGVITLVGTVGEARCPSVTTSCAVEIGIPASGNMPTSTSSGMNV
ncbi:hypothetical protein OG21DRAFT_212009 [Imleria badia]|nr:hypothetical protein OG21DRAFT_212009 [Imleria badia]